MDLEKLKMLAGIKPSSAVDENISYTGTEKKKLEREHNIDVGSPEWFKLWFSRPYLTGEKPIDIKKKKSDE